LKRVSYFKPLPED
jgi:signal-transduction protein with cAMP-binding, CBS, and nucleotidyltransferase domain